MKVRMPMLGIVFDGAAMLGAVGLLCALVESWWKARHPGGDGAQC